MLQPDSLESRIPNRKSPFHCRRCDSRHSTIGRFRAVGGYDGALRDIIHAFKYDKRLSLALGLSRLMRKHGADLLSSCDYVVPVPLHWRRQYARGFNQARELAVRLGPPVLDILVRHRSTMPQIQLSADQRHRNVAGAFAPRWWFGHSMRQSGKHVVLVDDVMTTGSTLEACAMVLVEAGAGAVDALTAARVQER